MIKYNAERLRDNIGLNMGLRFREWSRTDLGLELDDIKSM